MKTLDKPIEVYVEEYEKSHPVLVDHFSGYPWFMSKMERGMNNMENNNIYKGVIIPDMGSDIEIS